MKLKTAALTAAALICIFTLPLAACNPDKTPATTAPDTTTTASQTTTPPATTPAMSVCDLSEALVGQDVRAQGKLGIIDRSDPQGLYADLEEKSCHVGLWIGRDLWDTWSEAEQALLDMGTVVVAEGQLMSYEGNLVIELAAPLTAATEPVTDIEAALSGLNLVATPLAEKRLDVALVYSGTDEPALCYLGSYAMLAGYADSNIDFTEVVAGSGYGASALYMAPANMLIEGTFLGSLGVAAQHEGFEYYVGALAGGAITDNYISADLLENARETIHTEDEAAAFDLLRRLISSGIPVEVYLDCSLAKEVLIAHTSYLEAIFAYHDLYLDSAHVSHYFVATGYDDDYIYLNDPTEPAAGMGKDIPMDTATFLTAWGNSNDPSLAEEEQLGPCWMLFLGQRGAATSTADLLAWNREIAAAAPEEIRMAADDPDIEIIPLINCRNMSRARLEFGSYLKRNGYAEAGDLFLEVGELFAGLCQSADPGADLHRIADLQEQALTKW